MFLCVKVISSNPELTRQRVEISLYWGWGKCEGVTKRNSSCWLAMQACCNKIAPVLGSVRDSPLQMSQA